MSLGFGGVFPRTGLEQDTGLLRPRWGQDGSALKNFVVDLTADATVYTVTAGKKFYVASIVITTPTTSGGILLKDGGAGGTAKLDYKLNSATAGLAHAYFDPPLEFATDLYYDEDGTVTGSMTITGWEE